ncbi:hypothetical protein E0Z10_g7439 [Xylaria hypoxylon]|uniref:C2H2-type domain-containing protein n=1 Tax=Xylaria hypoxylon TaxID=37992 RepID=A0A4Z0YV20_9PEZI|nr:hypothetical protein E0Z10_g7439 [Xylaria hypoxylon]
MMNASPQTDTSNADTPGHRIPDASGPPIILSHARQAASPEGPAAQGEYDQDVCVCITCHTRCSNNATLRKHGKDEDHHPYGCVCGNTFSRLDVLRRHIRSKNNVNDFFCPLCEHDETPRAFSRPDHLLQHLRTFHRIPAGRIPEHFGANFSHNRPAEDSIVPHQSMPRYPCPTPGCMRTGVLAFLQQTDLDEHVVLMHSAPQNAMFVQQGLDDPAPAPTLTNEGIQQSAYLMPVEMFGQDAQQVRFLQPDQLDPAGIFQADWGFLGNDVFAANLDLQPDEDFEMDFSLDT